MAQISAAPCRSAVRPLAPHPGGIAALRRSSSSARVGPALHLHSSRGLQCGHRQGSETPEVQLATAPHCSSAQAPAAAPAAPFNIAGLIGVLAKVAAVACVTLVVAHLWPGPAAAAAASTAAAPPGPLATMLSFILNLDHHLSGLITHHGKMVYAILWAIVFCETGLVLTPFLPGDSLLFAAGAFAGMGKLSIPILMAVFISSAILGDMANYSIGHNLGRWAMDKGIIKKEHIRKTEKFYEKYGGKTVVLARFVPIVRTFAPFVAGIGSMSYSEFAQYNVVGAILWTVLFVGVGFFFGNLPFVQKNFTAVVLAIVAVSIVPVGFEVMAARKEAAEEKLLLQQQQQQHGNEGGSAAPA